MQLTLPLYNLLVDVLFPGTQADWAMARARDSSNRVVEEWNTARFLASGRTVWFLKFFMVTPDGQPIRSLNFEQTTPTMVVTGKHGLVEYRVAPGMKYLVDMDLVPGAAAVSYFIPKVIYRKTVNCAGGLLTLALVIIAFLLLMLIPDRGLLVP